MATKARPWREDCGCTHDGARWLEMCPEHAREFAQTHERWSREKREREAAAKAAQEKSAEYLDLL